VIQLIRVTTTSTEAEIQERGAYLTHFRFKGKDIVLPGAERQTRGGMALLIPFANRVRGGAYQWDGKTVTLLRNYWLFLITSKYRFDKLCLYSITEVVFIDDPPN
jgi:Galactose mutarotase and related enzymes